MNGISLVSNGRHRWAFLALAAVALVVGLLALAPQASAAGKILNVNPASGKDTNPGTTALPLKTLTRALSLVGAGDTVKLAGGGYGTTPQGFGSGETFPAGGLLVPSGVTIEGATDAGFPVSTLLGQGSGIGLNLAGNATIRNLVFGFQGFGVGIVARQGTQTLSNLFIPVRASRSGNVDGVPFSAGIVLRGTAQTTLNAGAQVKLSWTHPQSWRLLKDVQLRLVRGDKPVGRVAFDVRSRSLRAAGAAHLAGGVKFSRGVAGGKGVKVAFALRFDRGQAGRYRLELAATATNGKRQAFAPAGSLRITR